MSSYPPPQFNPDGQLNEIFNINDFKHNYDYATMNDLRSYGHLFKYNYWSAYNVFTDISIVNTINNIAVDIFNLITYLPNIITTLTNISFNSDSNTTVINGFLNVDESINTDNNINVGNNIHCNDILNQSIITNSINTNNIIINGSDYFNIIGYVYINSVLSMPISNSLLINEFNQLSITTLHFTLKPNYKIEFLDIDNNILFSYRNISSKLVYQIDVNYNPNMIKINLYNKNNFLL